MLDALKIRTVRSGRGLAALVVAATCLLLSAPTAAPARQPSANDWVGKVVLPKVRNFVLKDAQKGSPVKGPAEIYHVTRVSGKSVLLTGSGVTGWALARPGRRA